MRKILEWREYREWSELSEKEKIVHIYDTSKSPIAQFINNDSCDTVQEYFEQYLKERDLPADDIAWSLSNCQGDGVAFYGHVEITPKLWNELMPALNNSLKEELCALLDAVSSRGEGIEFTLSRNSFGRWYTHGHCISVGWETAGWETEREESALDVLSELLLSYVRGICKHLEREGYAVLEHDTSEAYVAEFCEDNGILFDAHNNACWGYADDLANDSGVAAIPTVVIDVRGGYVAKVSSECRMQAVIVDQDVASQQDVLCGYICQPTEIDKEYVQKMTRGFDE